MDRLQELEEQTVKSGKGRRGEGEIFLERKQYVTSKLFFYK